MFSEERGVALVAYSQSTAAGWLNSNTGRASEWVPARMAGDQTPGDGQRSSTVSSHFTRGQDGMKEPDR